MRLRSRINVWRAIIDRIAFVGICIDIKQVGLNVPDGWSSFPNVTPIGNRTGTLSPECEIECEMRRNGKWRIDITELAWRQSKVPKRAEIGRVANWLCNRWQGVAFQ